MQLFICLHIVFLYISKQLKTTKKNHVKTHKQTKNTISDELLFIFIYLSIYDYNYSIY